jgi:hypothetical protein
MLAALTTTNLFTCYFLLHVEQKKKAKMEKEKREKNMQTFFPLVCLYSLEPISFSYCTILDRTVLSHSLSLSVSLFLFIVLET